MRKCVKQVYNREKKLSLKTVDVKYDSETGEREVR